MRIQCVIIASSPTQWWAQHDRFVRRRMLCQGHGKMWHRCKGEWLGLALEKMAGNAAVWLLAEIAAKICMYITLIYLLAQVHIVLDHSFFSMLGNFQGIYCELGRYVGTLDEWSLSVWVWILYKFFEILGGLISLWFDLCVFLIFFYVIRRGMCGRSTLHRVCSNGLDRYSVSTLSRNAYF